MCGVFNHDFCQALQNGIMKHLSMCNIVSVGLVLSLSTISTLAVLLWLQSVQLSDTAMRMISEMLSGQNMFRDDYFDNIYPCIEREEIYSQRDSSKVYKVSQSQAIKRIDMNLEQDYTDRSISDLSRNDTVGIGCFLQTCQEAVLQYDLFKGHDNIAQVHDRWIQANPDQHGTTLEAKPMLDVINYFKQKMENKSPMFTETIRQALKNIRGEALILLDRFHSMLTDL